MTRPKKRPRLITVDGATYRWRIRQHPARPGPLAFAIERAGRPGTVLLATVPTHGTTPPPASVLVSTVIREAYAAGWRPGSPGPAFALTVDPRVWAN